MQVAALYRAAADNQTASEETQRQDSLLFPDYPGKSAKKSVPKMCLRKATKSSHVIHSYVVGTLGEPRVSTDRMTLWLSVPGLRAKLDILVAPGNVLYRLQVKQLFSMRLVSCRWRNAVFGWKVWSHRKLHLERSCHELEQCSEGLSESPLSVILLLAPALKCIHLCYPKKGSRIQCT